MSHFDRRLTTTAHYTEVGFDDLRDTSTTGFTGESRLFSRKENIYARINIYVVFIETSSIYALVHRRVGWKFFSPASVAIRFDMEGKNDNDR